MPQNVVGPAMKNFIFAGQHVGSVKFWVGQEWTEISLSHGAVNKDGAVEVYLTPEGARAIARDLNANADKDQQKLFLKKA